MKNFRIFLSENFHFLVVKFSVYLNRHVFVMQWILWNIEVLWTRPASVGYLGLIVDTHIIFQNPGLCVKIIKDKEIKTTLQRSVGRRFTTSARQKAVVHINELWEQWAHTCTHAHWKYSWLSLSGLRLSQITTYLEVKIWSLFYVCLCWGFMAQ